MILPPLVRDPRADDHLDVDYADERVPDPLAYDGRHAAPLADHLECDTPGPGPARHLFDALTLDEGDRYDEDDKHAPSRFRLNLTCVRCGLVVKLDGTLTPHGDYGDRERTVRLEAEPVRFGGLVAQHVAGGSSPRRDMSTWTVYRDTVTGPRRVGVIAWAIGPRGRAYFVGRLGDRRRWAEQHADDRPRVEAATPLGVLRKLARYVTVADDYLAELDADLEAWRETVRADQARRHAEADQARARERAGLPRVVPIRRQEPTP